MTTVLDAIKVELTISREALLLELSAAPDSVLEARPTEDAWSISEVLDHVAHIERRVSALLASSIEGRPDDADTTHVSAETLIAQTDAVMSELGAEPLKSPYVPQRGLSRATLTDALESSRAHLFRLIEAAHGIDLSQMSYPHPFFGELNMYQWLVFISRHDDRHRAQVARLRGAMQPS